MSSPADELLTLRDLLRYAVTRFRQAGIVYGHGTSNALDEAAFLLLWGLNLPIDQFDPFADARLLRSERERLLGLIEARITTRKPAAYITGEAWIKGHRFIVDERVIVPRSFIGELLAGGGLDFLEGHEPPGRILDLCTGSGCLAILAALAVPAARVDTVELSAEALEVAKQNVAEYGLEDRVTLYQGDLFAPLADQRYDLILSNPPYVTEAAVADFPPEHAHEPRMAHAGGPDGLDLVRRILADAPAHANPGARLLVEVGSGQAALAAAFPDTPFLWLDTEEAQGEVFLLALDDLPPSPVRRRNKKSAASKGSGR
jgi:ribosomal protein L3 glutamine methyltransferase